MAGFRPNPNDPLDMFLAKFFEKRIMLGLVPLHGAVHKIEDVTSVIWYRKGPFQIQLFIVPPNYVIPEHTHPNVDSYEVYVGGQIRFSHKGKWSAPEQALAEPTELGTCSLRGSLIRVHPEDKHGGVFGEAGGVFFSVQRWLNGVKPHCVAADYAGVVMGPDHMRRVVAGEPELKAALDWNDAASNEEVDGFTGLTRGLEPAP